MGSQYNEAKNSIIQQKRLNKLNIDKNVLSYKGLLDKYKRDRKQAIKNRLNR